MVDTVPYVEWPVRVDGEWQILNSDDVFKDKRVIVFALPGAFTPTCSAYQLPGYEDFYEEIAKYNIDDIYCLSVNDSFVMNKWAQDQNVTKVKMIPDGSAKFTHAMGMLVAKDNLGFGIRSWRYAMVVDNGRIEKMFEEPGKASDVGVDPYEVSDPLTMIEYLKGGRQIELNLSDSTEVKEKIGR